MLGLIVIYFIGKTFYDLAQEHDKNGWPFAILGVVSYYAGTFFAGIILAILYDIMAWGSIEEMNDISLGLLALPFGIFTCWLVYMFLKKQFEREPIDNINDDILDDFSDLT